jgi:uncharacterized membrane protein YhhN
MKTLFRDYGLIVFVFIAGVHLFSLVVDIEALRFVTKMLLMPSLAATVFCTSDDPKKNYIITALVFSFLGDFFLLLEGQNPLFFIFGLLAFLVTHILYIIYFTRTKTPGKSLLNTQPYIPVLIVAYGVGLVYLLYPALGNLKIPVIFYAVVICSMLLSTFYVYRTVGRVIGFQFIAGALLFVISDSLLAINKFYEPLPLAGILIMLTYCAAQYFIVRGFINHDNKNSWNTYFKSNKVF